MTITLMNTDNPAVDSQKMIRLGEQVAEHVCLLMSKFYGFLFHGRLGQLPNRRYIDVGAEVSDIVRVILQPNTDGLSDELAAPVQHCLESAFLWVAADLEHDYLGSVGSDDAIELIDWISKEMRGYDDVMFELRSEPLVCHLRPVCREG